MKHEITRLWVSPCSQSAVKFWRQFSRGRWKFASLLQSTRTWAKLIRHNLRPSASRQVQILLCCHNPSVEGCAEPETLDQCIFAGANWVDETKWADKWSRPLHHPARCVLIKANRSDARRRIRTLASISQIYARSWKMHLLFFLLRSFDIFHSTLRPQVHLSLWEAQSFIFVFLQLRPFSQSVQVVFRRSAAAKTHQSLHFAGFLLLLLPCWNEILAFQFVAHGPRPLCQKLAPDLSLRWVTSQCEFWCAEIRRAFLNTPT